MFLIENGRTSFYQWDTGQRLIVNHAEVTEVHFAHPVASEALRREVYEEDGQRLVDVPDVVLTQPRALMVYGCCEECVRAEAVFRVVAREKPTDYIYTEEERREYDALRAQVYAMCPTFEESGATVVCQPMVGYPLGVVSGIEAVQAGSGDPSPENVRPIAGHEVVTVHHMGKNLLPYPYVDGSEGAVVQRNGITFTILADRGIKVEGTAETGTYFVLQRGADYGNTVIDAMSNPAGHSNGKYAVSHRLFYNSTSKTLSLNVSAGATVNDVLYPQIEVGTVSTAYEPYKDDTHTAQFSGTVYGGSFDWERGVLTVTHGVIVLTGAENFAQNGAGHYYWTHGQTGGAAYNPICSHFLGSYNGAYNDKLRDSIAVRNTRLWVYAPRFVTTSELAAYLSAQYAAGTPVTVVYELTEPHDVQLTGQTITATEGTNTLTSSTGGTTVSGRSNPAWMIAELTARVAALEAAVVTE